MVTLSVAEHRLISVTVTVYVVGDKGETNIVEMDEPGEDQL